MKIIQIDQDNPNYPSALQRHLSSNAPPIITAIGNTDILRKKTLAILSSIKCPGDIILKTYDIMRQLRDADVTIISGFHSPMERECLNIMLRGKQPVIISPARSIEKIRIKGDFKKPLEEGKLLFLSPFTEKDGRITAERAFKRNLFIAALANAIFIAYAEHRGKTEQFCREVLAWNKMLYTIDSDVNKNLISMGMKPVTVNNMCGWVSDWRKLKGAATI